MRILDGKAGASTFKVNLRVWKEGPPGSSPPGFVTWCGDWRHPNCPGHFQRNKEGGRTPRESHWKRSLLWSKMYFSRKWRMIPLVLKDLQRFCVVLETCWSLLSLRAVMRRNCAQNHPALTPWGCWGWPVSSPRVLWAWNPLIIWDGRGPTGTPLGQRSLGLYATDLYQVHDLQTSCAILDGRSFSLFLLCTTTFVLKKPNSSLLPFVVYGFGSRSKKSRPDPNSWSFSLMFSSMGCIILVLTSRPLIHFELILNSEGSRGPTLFLCRWNLVVPEPVLIVGENICKWCHQKGLISKIHKQHMHLKKINK